MMKCATGVFRQEPTRLSAGDRCVLTGSESDLLWHVVRRRQRENAIAGCVERITDKEQTERNRFEFLGLCAEFGIAKMMNLFPDLSTEPRSGGIDLVSMSGVTLDIKASAGRCRDGRICRSDLLIPRQKDSSSEAEIYMLADYQRWIERGQVSIVFAGWAYSKDVITEQWWNENMPRPCWVYPRALLHGCFAW